MGEQVPWRKDLLRSTSNMGVKLWFKASRPAFAPRVPETPKSPRSLCQAWSFYVGFKVTAGASLGASCITPELGPPSHSLSPPPSLLHRGGAGEISSYTSSRKSFFFFPFTKKASESLGGRGTLIIDNCGEPSWRSVGVCAFPHFFLHVPRGFGSGLGGWR